MLRDWRQDLLHRRNLVDAFSAAQLHAHGIRKVDEFLHVKKVSSFQEINVHFRVCEMFYDGEYTLIAGNYYSVVSFSKCTVRH